MCSWHCKGAVVMLQRPNTAVQVFAYLHLISGEGKTCSNPLHIPPCHIHRQVHTHFGKNQGPSLCSWHGKGAVWQGKGQIQLFKCLDIFLRYQGKARGHAATHYTSHHAAFTAKNTPILARKAKYSVNTLTYPKNNYNILELIETTCARCIIPSFVESPCDPCSIKAILMLPHDFKNPPLPPPHGNMDHVYVHLLDKNCHNHH